MSIICTRCDGTGFLNLEQIDPSVYGDDIPDLSDVGKSIAVLAYEDNDPFSLWELSRSETLPEALILAILGVEKWKEKRNGYSNGG
jgi:hypothetical protein